MNTNKALTQRSQRTLQSAKAEKPSRKEIVRVWTLQSAKAEKPSRKEICQGWIQTLTQSWGVPLGRGRYRVDEAKITQEIACIEAVIGMIEGSECPECVLLREHRLTILRSLWNYDTQASRRAYEAIKFTRRSR